MLVIGWFARSSSDHCALSRLYSLHLVLIQRESTSHESSRHSALHDELEELPFLGRNRMDDELFIECFS